jgi:hypothetical protein
MAPAAARQNEYFVPRDGIDREVITSDICRYLGNDALVRPGTYEVRWPHRRPSFTAGTVSHALSPTVPRRPCHAGLLHYSIPEPDVGECRPLALRDGELFLRAVHLTFAGDDPGSQGRLCPVGAGEARRVSVLRRRRRYNAFEPAEWHICDKEL